MEKPAIYLLNRSTNLIGLLKPSIFILVWHQSKTPIIKARGLKNDAYDNSRIYKEKIKSTHNKLILRMNFESNQRIHLYDSRMQIHPRKLRSEWTGPYVVQRVFSNGVVQVKDPKHERVFKVNVQRLKHYI